MKKNISILSISLIFLLANQLSVADAVSHSSLRSTTQAVKSAVTSSIRAAFKTYKLREELNLHNNPNPYAPIIKTLKKGTIIAPSGRSQGRWLEVSDNQNMGWVYSYSSFQ